MRTRRWGAAGPGAQSPSRPFASLAPVWPGEDGEADVVMECGGEASEQRRQRATCGASARTQRTGHARTYWPIRQTTRRTQSETDRRPCPSLLLLLLRRRSHSRRGRRTLPACPVSVPPPPVTWHRRRHGPKQRSASQRLASRNTHGSKKDTGERTRLIKQTRTRCGLLHPLSSPLSLLLGAACRMLTSARPRSSAIERY